MLAPALYEAISQRPKVGQPDVPRLVAALGRGEALLRIPKKRRRRPRVRLCVVLDRSPEIAPLWSDQDLVAGWVHKSAPSGVAEVVQTPFLGPGWPQPEPDLATLFVTDAGLWGRDSTRRKAWVKEAARRRQANETSVICLLLGRPTVHDVPLGLWSGWVAPLNKPSAPSMRDVQRLLALASLSGQVEADLLRELRMEVLASGDPRVELGAWHRADALDWGNTATAEWKGAGFCRARKMLVEGGLLLAVAQWAP